MNTDRRSLAQQRDRMMASGLSWVRQTRRFQRTINMVGVMGGGTLAVIGGGMDGPMIPETGDGILTMKGACVIVGAIMVLIASLILLFLQDEAPEMLARAAKLESEAQGYLDERDGLTRRLEGLAALDRRRLALIEANRAMRETLENALLEETADIAGTAQLMLDAALRFITTSIGFDHDETWAISVFRVEGAELRRIAARRADRLGEQNHSRSWPRNEGFVGRAWATEEAVIVADGSLPEALDEFNVSPKNRRAYDSDRYRSMAAIPVRLGSDPVEIWGVVAASTDCAGRFRRDPLNKQVQAVDTVRLIARMIALTAAAFRRSE